MKYTEKLTPISIGFHERNHIDTMFNHLHHPHSQPESHCSSHHGEEAQEREGGIEGFSHCHLLLYCEAQSCFIKAVS